MPVSPRRGQRKNSPFTKEQETWIVLEFGAIRNCLTVKRKFRSKFKVDPRNVPSIVAFERLVERFFSTPGHVRPALPTGRSPLSEEIVQRVREHLSPFVERGNPFLSGRRLTTCTCRTRQSGVWYGRDWAGIPTVPAAWSPCQKSTRRRERSSARGSCGSQRSSRRA